MVPHAPLCMCDPVDDESFTRDSDINAFETHKQWKIVSRSISVLAVMLARLGQGSVRRTVRGSARLHVAQVAASQPETLKMTAAVGVVTTIGCPYCKKAKAALKERGVEFAEADLGSARDVLAKVKETTGQTTVPQV
jgi:glutaredoxin